MARKQHINNICRLKKYREYPRGYDVSDDQRWELMDRFIFLTPELLSNSHIPLSNLYDFCGRTCSLYAVGSHRGLSTMHIHLLSKLIVGLWYPYYVPSFGNVGPEQEYWKYGEFLVKAIGC